MINRASVQLWGKAGQTAGPPKSAGKKRDRESDCLFPLSKIAHWSILLRGNGVFFIIADPAAELRPHSPHDRPHSLHDRPLAPMIGPIVP